MNTELNIGLKHIDFMALSDATGAAIRLIGHDGEHCLAIAPNEAVIAMRDLAEQYLNSIATQPIAEAVLGMEFAPGAFLGRAVINAIAVDHQTVWLTLQLAAGNVFLAEISHHQASDLGKALLLLNEPVTGR